METHEPQVLEGMGTYLGKFKPTLLVEILNDEVANAIEILVSDCQYLYFNLNEKGGIRQTKSIVKSDFYNYLICSKEVAMGLKLI